jgi:hypothetical protein
VEEEIAVVSDAENGDVEIGEGAPFQHGERADGEQDRRLGKGDAVFENAGCLLPGRLEKLRVFGIAAAGILYQAAEAADTPAEVVEGKSARLAETAQKVVQIFVVTGHIL